MLRLLFGEMPQWAQTEHSALRQELTRFAPPNRTPLQKIWRTLQIILAMLALVLIGYYFATNGFTESPAENFTQGIWQVLFLPSLFLQAITSAIALMSGFLDSPNSGIDHAIKTTPKGIRLWVRAKWLGGFLRLRHLLMWILAMRMVMIGAMLIDMTAMRGSYLTLLGQLNANPSMPLPVTMLVVVLGLTGALVFPIASIGMEIALSLWARYGVKERSFAFLAQFSLLGLRLILMAGSVWLWERVQNNEVIVPVQNWYTVLGGYTVLGDWGLWQLNLAQMGQFWETVPNSAVLCGLLVGFVFVQLAIISLALRFTVTGVERIE
jgi:hypothetical protein